MGLTRALPLLLVAACSGTKSKGAKDATHEPPPGDAAAGSADAGAGASASASGKGDVQVRVEWKDVPMQARQSPGRNACGFARAPLVAPTVTWGVPDVVVMIDAAAPAHERAAPRITLETCALSPRVVLAQTSFVVASATESPVKLSLHRAGAIPFEATRAAADAGTPVYLPTAGHSVEVPIENKTIYRLDADEDSAWIVASDAPFVAITEPNGQATLRDVPAGTHPVTAWLPGPQPHVAHGVVTVTDGALAEVTLDISK